MPESVSALESESNSIYQNSMSFYEKAMNGDRSHPFVLFKISQLRLMKSNFKKIKEIEDIDKANVLRQILIDDIKTFVKEVKEYEIKMKAIKEDAKKKAALSKKHSTTRPKYQPRNNQSHSENTGNSRRPYNSNFRNNTNTKASNNMTYKPYGHNDNRKVDTPKVEEQPKQNTTNKKTNSKYMKTMNFKKKGSKR